MLTRRAAAQLAAAGTGNAQVRGRVAASGALCSGRRIACPPQLRIVPPCRRPLVPHQFARPNRRQPLPSCAQAANAGSWGATKPRNGLRPRDSNVPVVSQAAAAEKPAAAGRSMSQLLQSRSEAVMSGGKTKKQCVPTLPDIDTTDAADPLNATDFVADIFSYYKRVEPQLRVAPDYMTRQVGPAWGLLLPGVCRRWHVTAELLAALRLSAALPRPIQPPLLPVQQTDINDKMRAILIDWLVDVHLKFKVQCGQRLGRTYRAGEGCGCSPSHAAGGCLLLRLALPCCPSPCRPTIFETSPPLQPASCTCCISSVQERVLTSGSLPPCPCLPPAAHARDAVPHRQPD